MARSQPMILLSLEDAISMPWAVVARKGLRGKDCADFARSPNQAIGNWGDQEKPQRAFPEILPWLETAQMAGMPLVSTPSSPVLLLS